MIFGEDTIISQSIEHNSADKSIEYTFDIDAVLITLEAIREGASLVRTVVRTFPSFMIVDPLEFLPLE